MNKPKKSKNIGKTTRRNYSELTSLELDRIAERFDKEMIPDQPLTPALRDQLRRAKAKRGRPVVGEGAQQVLVTIERGLLREADAYAKRHNRNRSQLIVEGLNWVIGRERRKAS